MPNCIPTASQPTMILLSASTFDTHPNPFTPSIRWLFGILTPSNLRTMFWTGLNGIFLSILCLVTPGAVRSTKKQPTSPFLLSSRAKTDITSPCPLPIHFLLPWSTKFLFFSSQTALVSMLLASDPTFSSVSPQPPMRSHLCKRGRYCNFSSSEPYSSRVLPSKQCWAANMVDTEPSTLEISITAAILAHTSSTLVILPPL